MDNPIEFEQIKLKEKDKNDKIKKFYELNIDECPICLEPLDFNPKTNTNNQVYFDDNEIKIDRNEITELSVGTNIVLGNAENTARTVTVHGRLAVGVANPDPEFGLTVAGPVSFENKKFKVGTSAPTTGDYNKGDIVWNTDPKANDYVGWVCINPGSPGFWLPFGVIASA